MKDYKICFSILNLVILIGIIIYLCYRSFKVQNIEGFSAGNLNLEALQNISSLLSKGFMPTAYMIVMWHGSSVPKGWVLCDGRNGTPDLSDKFIVGAGPTMKKGSTGGNNQIKLTSSNLPSHKHKYFDSFFAETKKHIKKSGIQAAPNNPGNIVGSSDTDHDNDIIGRYQYTDTYGSASPTPLDNRPKYYALAFIMKTP